MYELIIAEKKDAALQAAKALSGTYKSFNGYIVGENDNRIYTWAIGFLVQLAEPATYDPKWANWEWDSLPMIPQTIKTEIIPNEYTKKQANVIKELAHRSDISRIINFCDSAEVGQLIYETLKMHLKFNKPDMRLWTNSLMPDAIRKAYKEMKPNSEYKNLKTAAMTRAISDWLVGLNSTRALSLKASGVSEGNNSRVSTVIRTGRVMTPTLHMVYQREMIRGQFKKINYYPLQVKFAQNSELFEATLVTEKITDRNVSEQIFTEIKKGSAQVTHVDEKDKRTPPPLLLNLTSLSRIANERHGFTAQKALDVLASLYLKNYVTYPRTDSEYVSEAEIPLMHKSFDVLKGQFPHYADNSDVSIVNTSNKRICRPEKVNDHHAVLPEPVIAKDLTEDQQKIYEIVVERFFAQFQNDKEYKQKDIMVEASGHKLFARYKQTINSGWESIFKKEDDDPLQEDEQTFNGYPNISIGPVQILEGDVLEKETAPPPSYTDGSLITDMENVGKYVENEKLKAKLKDIGIGTSATRAGIIKKLIDTEYLVYKNTKSIGITKKGIAVIELIKNSGIQLLISPEMTALWEKELEDIRQGKSNEHFMQSIVAFTNKIVSEAKVIKLDEAELYEFLGECPVCKEGIVEGNKRYYCSNYKNGCTFFIWSKQYNKAISHKMLEQLLTKGATSYLTFTSKAKNKFKARFILDMTELNGNVKLDFEDKKTK